MLQKVATFRFVPTEIIPKFECRGDFSDGIGVSAGFLTNIEGH